MENLEEKKLSEKKDPTVEFTFWGGKRTPEEIARERAELLRKRNELLAARGRPIPSYTVEEAESLMDDFPRRAR